MIDYSTIFRTMVKWALIAFKTFLFFARKSFIYKGMKLLLFPAVTELTFFQPFTAFFITCYESSTLPVFAKFCFISKKIWLPSKILEVMRIYTLCFIVFVIVRTPFSLKVKDIEVEIRMLREQMMNETDLYILN